MSLRRQNWIASAGLHLLLLILVVVILDRLLPPPLARVHVQFSMPAAHSGASISSPISSLEAPKSAKVPQSISPKDQSKVQKDLQVEAAVWQDKPQNKQPENTSSFDEPLWTASDLLLAEDLQQKIPQKKTSQAMWSGEGDVQENLPPPPPAHLLPVSGAEWNLVFTVAASGGLAVKVDGLDSGQPELDQWLDQYLKTLSFPSSSQEYQIKWTLRLRVSRPE